MSIHLLHVKQVDVKLPNLYLNLARLLAVGDWTLLMPGGPHNSSLTEQNSPVNFEAKLGAYLLTSGGHTYPFPDLSPLLIRKDSNFWCTGRFFPGGSRSLDWNECLWQLHLEMTGKTAIVDVAQSNGKADPTEGPLNPDVSLPISSALDPRTNTSTGNHQATSGSKVSSREMRYIPQENLRSISSNKT